MASIFKRTRWIDQNGRRCPADHPGARRVESKFWAVKISVPGRGVRTFKGYRDRGATEQMAAKLEREKARGEQLMVDPYREHRARAIGLHVADWTADLKAKRRSSMYIYNAGKRLAKLIDQCGWKVLADITADSFCRWREKPIEQPMAGTKEDRTIGPVTLNQYLETLRAFCLWAVDRKRIASNPVATVEEIDPTSDIRRERRALTIDQVGALLAVEAMPADHRAVYRFILSTGLRRAEAAALQWGDVRLNAPLPFIQLRAKATKAKRADSVPLRAELAQELRQQRGEAGDGDRVFRSIPSIKEHRGYLAAAEIDWEDDQGRRADFHAIRHTYGTLLSNAGVMPREAMELMRHTDMRLTMKVYTDPRIFNLKSAVEKLPIPAAEKVAAVATGTDDATADPRSTIWNTKPSADIGYSSSATDGLGDGVKESQPVVTDGDARRVAGSDGHTEKAGVLGFEPSPSGPKSYGNTGAECNTPASGAPFGTPRQCPPMPADQDFEVVRAAWPNLPADVRRTIVGVVKLSIPR